MRSEEPEVRAAAGIVRGREEDGVAVFRGMPFAQAPVGGLRFAAPQPVRQWEGVREAAALAPLRCGTGGRVEPAPGPRSDRLGEFGKRSGDPRC
jgi:carboxylesterase type B